MLPDVHARAHSTFSVNEEREWERQVTAAKKKKNDQRNELKRRLICLRANVHSFSVFTHKIVPLFLIQGDDVRKHAHGQRTVFPTF